VSFFASFSSRGRSWFVILEGVLGDEMSFYVGIAFTLNEKGLLSSLDDAFSPSRRFRRLAM